MQSAVTVTLMPLLIFCSVHRSRYSQYLSMGRTTPKIALSLVNLDRNYYMVSLAHSSLPSNQPVDRFSRLLQDLTNVTDRQTGTHTHTHTRTRDSVWVRSEEKYRKIRSPFWPNKTSHGKTQLGPCPTTGPGPGALLALDAIGHVTVLFFRRVSAVLGSVLHDQHRQRGVHPLRPQARRLPDRPDALLVLRLARLHEQLPQPGHLHHLQHGVPASIQEDFTWPVQLPMIEHGVIR